MEQSVTLCPELLWFLYNESITILIYFYFCVYENFYFNLYLDFFLFYLFNNFLPKSVNF